MKDLNQSEQVATQEKPLLVIVEPDALTRWSLKVYLKRWFEVAALGSIANAMRFLSAKTAEYAIVSDEVEPGGLAELEQALHRKKPSAKIILLVSKAQGGVQFDRKTAIEKPFRLSELARLLLPGLPAEKTGAS